MTIVLNGESRQLDSATAISGLLEELGLNRQPVLVEHNGNALHPRQFEDTQLAEGDKIELIRIVAGG